MGIAEILLPVAIVGVIAVFVVVRMIQKTNKDTLGKKKEKEAQNVLDSLIPPGMIFGAAAAVFLGTPAV